MSDRPGSTEPGSEPAAGLDPLETGYAQVGDLRVHYALHGRGGTPLVLLHGGLFDARMQWEHLLPALSAARRVIAIDLQGHGRTNDTDRPLTAAGLAGDVAGVLEQLGVDLADVFGFSLGGAAAIELAVRRPELVRRLVVGSIAFARDGERGENTAAVGAMTVDLIAGSPIEQNYLAVSPHPDREHLQTLLTKIGAFLAEAPGWTEDEIAGITAPTLITVGDGDMVKLDHAIRFFQLRGGDVNADFAGLPASQLAVFPGTSHFFGIAHTEQVLAAVLPFLDTPDGVRESIAG